MTEATTYASWYAAGTNEALGVGEFFEEIIEAVYSAILVPGDFAIDRSANRGRHTFPMRTLTGDGGLVIAVEPLLSVALLLMAPLNHESISKVVVIPQALAMKAGVVPFTHVTQGDCYSGIRTGRHIPAQMLPSVRNIQVPSTTLDAIALNSERKSVRFIKLDLEGGEHDALRGGHRVMRSEAAPLIVFEHAGQAAADVYGYRREDWFALFDTHGYCVYDLFGRRFGPEHWHASGVPWYLLAAKRLEDLWFVEQSLPREIAKIYARLMACERHAPISRDLAD